MRIVLGLAGMWALFIVTVTVGVMLSCDDAGVTPETPQQRYAKRAAPFNDLAAKITYLREPRSGLCFAYLWETSGYGESGVGGPALATVPCEAVQRLLVNLDEAPAQ